METDTRNNADANFKTVDSSQHQVYVTLEKPSDKLKKLYLTLLHWAVSNDGATEESKAVENTWLQFSKKDAKGKSVPANIRTWDGKRKLRYYGEGIDKCNNLVGNFLKAPDESSGGCGVFANLFIETLWVNGIASGCVNVFPPPENYEGMLIHNWEPLIDKHPNAPQGYRWKFRFSKGASMFPPILLNVYGNLTSVDGLAGQNVAMPIEKAFLDHFIVKISGTQMANLPYYDPSYGITYQDEEEFDREAVFGYFSDFAKEDDPAQWWVRRAKDRIHKKNILFERHEDKYPLCGTGPAHK